MPGTVTKRSRTVHSAWGDVERRERERAAFDDRRRRSHLREDRVQIDIAVRGREARETPLRLRQLALATDPIAAWSKSFSPVRTS